MIDKEIQVQIDELKVQVASLQLQILAHRCGVIVEQWRGDDNDLRRVCQYVLAKLEENPYLNREAAAMEAIALYTQRSPIPSNNVHIDGKSPPPPQFVFDSIEHWRDRGELDWDRVKHHFVDQSINGSVNHDQASNRTTNRVSGDLDTRARTEEARKLTVPIENQ